MFWVKYKINEKTCRSDFHISNQKQLFPTYPFLKKIHPWLLYCQGVCIGIKGRRYRPCPPYPMIINTFADDTSFE